MGFGQAIATCFKRYVDFGGRSSRSEFWWYILFVSLVLTGIYFAMFASMAGSMAGAMNADGTIDESAAMGAMASAGILGTIAMVFSLATFLPSLAATIRRLHDTSRSGWWIFIALIPLVGPIILIVFAAQASHPGDNAWGAEPAEHAAHRAKRAAA